MTVGCLADDVDPEGDLGVGDPGDPGPFTIGGEVTGLDADPVTLALNEDAETLEVEENGDFAFDTELEDGADYAVTVESQPDDRGCQVEDGTGTVAGADVEDIVVHCVGAPELSSISEPMQFHLSWEGPETVDLKYSSDPDCDWDNYSTCPDGEMLADVSGGEATFQAIADDFDPDTGWYFVAEVDGLRSNQVGARPGPVTVVDRSDVGATHIMDGTLYLGGNFEAVGMPTGGGAMLTADGAELTGSVPVLNRNGAPASGLVHDTAPDGTGGWYVAGDFDSVNGHERSNLVRIRADGSVDPEWHADTDGDVYTITVADDHVYVGGNFAHIEHGGGFFARERLAALDRETGAVVADWNPGANNTVYALEAGDELIYAGGAFFQVGQEDFDRENLAAFDPDDGSVDTSWTPEVTFGSIVYDLLASANRVYIGGAFSEIDDVAADNVAVVDATGGGIEPDWSARVDGDRVTALALAGERLFAGGGFSQAGGAPREHLAAFEADSGELVDDWAPDPNDPVQGMAAHEGRLYLVGEFDAFGAETVPRPHLAAVATDTGELDPDWAPAAGTRASLINGLGDISISGGAAYAGKDLVGIGAHRTSLAALDASSGTVDRDWQVELDDLIYTLAGSDDHVFVGGQFDHVGETERPNLAALTRENAELDADWDSVPDDTVQDLIVRDGHLYVGGRFDTVAGAAIANLARVDAASGDVDTGWDPEVAGSFVWTMLLLEDTLYAGGLFDTVGGDPQVNTAAIDIATAGNGAGWPDASNTVGAMAHHEDTLYIGGVFSGTESVGDEDRDRLAAIDLASGDVDAGWDPGAGDTVNRLAVHEGLVMVGGDFEAIGGGSGSPGALDRDHLAAVALADGDVDTDWDPAADGDVFGMVIDDGGVIVGGSFEQAGGGSGDDPERRFRPGLIKVDPATGELLW